MSQLTANPPAPVRADQRLADAQWRPVPFSVVIHAYLRAEWDRWPMMKWVDRRLVDEPDFDDAAANHLRKCLLVAARGGIVNRVPADTEWHEVRSLRTAHFGQLRVIGRCGWESPDDRNELLRVAQRRNLHMHGDMTSWDPPVLWGHSMAGPFTILEGNHRLTACARTASRDSMLGIRCFIGLSAEPCYWHLEDDFPNLPRRRRRE